MREGWEVKKLGEVCTLQRGFDLPKHSRTEGIYPLVSSNGITDKLHEWKVKAPGVVTGRSGSIGNVHYIEQDFWPLNTSLYVKNFHGNYPRYIYYLLTQFDLGRFTSGAGVPTLNRNNVHDEDVYISTSLSEQKQIVSILDEAFAAIAKAKEAAEKNLQNARAVFEIYLEKVFANAGEGWEEKKLGKITTVQSGGTPLRSKNEYWSGDIAWYSSGELNDLYTNEPERYITNLGLKNSNAKVFHKGSLLIGMYDTAALKMSILDRDGAFNQAIAGAQSNDEINLEFVRFAINAIKPELLNQRRGVRQKNLSLDKIKNISFFIPERERQDEVVIKLNSFWKEVQSLESVYQQKLSALEELKKSILQKAFAGELTASMPEIKVLPVAAKVIPLSPIDFQAGIIALALQRHEGAGNAKTFGHVKAEKIINTAEYELSLSLGRKPKKDAAGPLDFKRFLIVEALAAKADIFYVDKTEKGYRYTMGSQAKELIGKVKAALGEKYAALIKMIDTMVPLNTKETEVRATVYSAWNNLLLDGATITPEAIVLEARENWHPDKLKIERNKFFEAIDWLKAKDIEPKGTGLKIV